MSFRKIAGSALGLGVGLAMTVGGAAMANPNLGAGNIDPSVTSSLTIHKYEGAPVEGANNNGEVVTGITNAPLKGVSFKACPVTGVDIHNPADWNTITKLNDAISKDDNNPKHEFVTDVDGVTVGLGTDCLTGITDEDGEIVWPNVDQGVYYVTETGAPIEVAEHVLPFLVTVPMPTDGGWNYNVHVYPKNAKVDIEKEAVDGGTIGVGDVVEWKVTNTIPTVQREFDAYALLDKLDPSIEYVANSTVITLDGAPLVLGTDYTFNATNHSATDGQALRVDFTSVGLKKLDAANGKDIVWTFNTTVLKVTENGAIPNSASVLPNDPDNEWGTGATPPPPTEPPPGVPSEEVYSNWGGLRIFKFEENDKDGKALSGAVFQVFGSEADANACSTAVKAAKGNSLPAGCANAVEVSRDLAGNAITPAQNKFTTDENGNITIPGLHTGVTNVPAQPGDSTERDYWVVEIVPPAGFINEAEVIKYNVVTGKVTEASVLDVPNAQEPPSTLPQTGADISKALVWTALGLLAIGGGIAVVSRRKATQEEA